jgi:hypothetical protein
MNGRSLLLVVLLTAALPSSAATIKEPPSRPAEKGCIWQTLSDASLGLEAWVQRCDFGSRKIDFIVKGKSLAIRYSDGGGPDPLIDVLDLLPGETAEAGLKRLFAARTEKKVAQRCVLAPFRGTTARAGVKRYTFVPNAVYQKEIDAKANPNEIGDPPCGDFGDQPDGIQYFEVQPAAGARKVLFVRIGQDEPLFDEKTLRLLPQAH